MRAITRRPSFEPAQETAVAPASHIPCPVHPTVLVAAADASARSRHAAILAEAGIGVAEAATSAEILEIAHAGHPAVIVISSHLADGDAFTAVREWKSASQTAEIPVLILSPRNSAGEYAKAIESGADAWLSEPADEPIEAPILLATVDALLKRPRRDELLQSRDEAPTISDCTAKLRNAYQELLAESAERERAEVALRASEEEFRTLFENATVGLYRTTPDGRILMANPALVSMLGFDSFEELASRNLERDGAGPEYQRETFRRLVEGDGVLRGYESSWNRKDGTALFVRESARVIHDSAGAVLFYDGIVEDVTERKLMEDDLRRSEKRFRQMFDQAHVGVCKATMDGRIEIVNQRFCEITGYSRGELMGMTYLDITHPDDLAPNLRSAGRLLAGDIRSFTIEKRYIRKDGSTVWVKMNGSALLEHLGAPQSFLAIVEDISDRKQAEQDLRRELEFGRLLTDAVTSFATASRAEINDAISGSLHAVAEYCGADHALLIQGMGDGKTLRCSHQWCAAHVTPRFAAGETLSTDVLPWCAQKVLSGEDISVRNVNELPPEAAADLALLKEQGAMALLHVPIQGREGSVAGCIVLHQHQHPWEWQAGDLSRLRLLGNVILAVLQRCRAEEQSTHAEEKFGNMFRASPEPILITSVANHVIMDANPRVFDLQGYHREEMIGKTTEELQLFANPDDRERLWSILMEHGEVTDFELAIRTKHGEIREGLLSASVVPFRDDRYVIGMFRDLTERRRAEKELRRQAVFDRLMTQLLSEFLSCPPEQIGGALDGALSRAAAFFHADHVLLFNASVDTKSWHVAGEWCAPHVKPIPRTPPPGQRSLFWDAGKLFEDVDLIFDSEETAGQAGYFVEHYREEGATFSVTVPIKGVAGVITGRMGLHRHGGHTPWPPEDRARLRILGNAVATTLERKQAEDSLRQSEERFRNLVDDAPVITWTSSPERRATFFNAQALAMVGLTLEEAIGEGYFRLLHPDDMAQYLAVITAATNTRSPFSTEVRFRRVDGEYRWILITGIPRFEEGTYIGHVGTGVDVTDLKRSYEQHLASQNLESLGVLAAGVAHDFNNLLGAIVARAESAKSELPPGSLAAEDIGDIRLTATRAAEIVSQLMTFAGCQSGPSAPLDLSRLVSEMLNLLKVSISKNAILVTDLAQGLPPVHGNAAEIRQVIMNLILNASESLLGKPGSIRITTARAALAAGHESAVRLDVADNGCGMTDEVKARIFEPFFTTRSVGRGLGLSALQGIVRRHGGKIDVESAPGEGSRFAVLLPCSAALPSPDTPPAGLPAGSQVERGAVLFVEDEESLRAPVAKLLRRRNLDVIEVSDGAGAVAIMAGSEVPIAVVLLDVSMQGMPVAEIFDEVRRLRPLANIIVTTAYSRERATSELGLRTGWRFIRKPYLTDELVDTLRQAMDGSAAVV